MCHFTTSSTAAFAQSTLPANRNGGPDSQTQPDQQRASRTKATGAVAARPARVVPQCTGIGGRQDGGGERRSRTISTPCRSPRHGCERRGLRDACEMRSITTRGRSRSRHLAGDLRGASLQRSWRGQLRASPCDVCEMKKVYSAVQHRSPRTDLKMYIHRSCLAGPVISDDADELEEMNASSQENASCHSCD